MGKQQKTFLFLLRVSLGWMFFYAGLAKLLDPAWAARGYLEAAKSFGGLYNWLTRPGILPMVDFINEWGMTLLGLSLILGLFVRLSSPLGALMMFLYYLPILDFPLVGAHSYIVDEHIIYIFLLLFLGSAGAGKVWGLDSRVKINK